MRDDELKATTGSEVRMPTARVWRALRWLLLIGIAGYWSIRPQPIPTNVLYGGANGAPEAPAIGDVRSDSIAEPSEAIATDAAIRTIDWRLLALLDYRTTTLPPAIAALNGRLVRIPGFIVPLEDFQESAKEFLLVPYFGACVHMPPPPPNQMVFVTLKGGPKSLALVEPVWMEGVLEVKRVDSPYGMVSYRMSGQRIVPYRDAR